jgi:hypothetical protein
MRLRRTALPSAFLMLQPNRLRSRPLGRTKRVNSRLERRLPSRYTTSYSAVRAMRHSRGSPPGATSDSREAMTSLFAASGKDFPSTLAFHAFAEAVFFVTAAHMGLKRTFRQRILSSIFAGCAASAAELAHRMPSRTQANLVVYSTVAARSRKRARRSPARGRKLDSSPATYAQIQRENTERMQDSYFDRKKTRRSLSIRPRLNPRFRYSKKPQVIRHVLLRLTILNKGKNAIFRRGKPLVVLGN